MSRAHHSRNVALLGTVEMGWGAAMALLQPDSILPVLLARLGADKPTIALLPAVREAATFPCQLVSPYLTEGMPRMKGWIYALHAIPPLVWGALGLWLLSGPAPGARSLAIFFACYFVWNGLLGFLIPFWYDFMAKIVDPARRASAFSAIFTLQHVMGAAGAGGIAHHVLHTDAPDAYPRGYAVCFLVAMAAALLGNSGFIFTREEAAAAPPPAPRIATYFGGLLGHVRHDRALRRYLVARGVTRLSPIVATFYAVQAQEKIAVGFSVGALALTVIGGKLASSLLSWRFADASGMKPFLLLGYVALAAAAGVAAWADALSTGGWPWFVVAALVGVFQSADTGAHATFVMNLAPEGKRATYYIAVDACLFPVSVASPWILGTIAERVGLVPVQALASGLFLLAALFLAFLVDERQPRAA